jgi:hypothetical protein
MLVHFPAAGLQTKFGIYDYGILECAVAIAERYPHSALAEADDVGKSARGEPGEKTRMLFNAPAQTGHYIHDAPASQCSGSIELARVWLGPS